MSAQDVHTEHTSVSASCTHVPPLETTTCRCRSLSKDCIWHLYQHLQVVWHPLNRFQCRCDYQHSIQCRWETSCTGQKCGNQCTIISYCCILGHVDASVDKKYIILLSDSHLYFPRLTIIMHYALEGNSDWVYYQYTRNTSMVIHCMYKQSSRYTVHPCCSTSGEKTISLHASLITLMNTKQTIRDS